MLKEYTKKQFWELYKKLPENLQEIIFSAKTADIVWNVCQKNKIPNNNVSKIAEIAGRVLLGVLPLDEFQEIIRAELKIKEIVAKKISLEVNRLIFSQVKDDLAKFSGVEKKPILESEETLKKSPGKDTYREPVE